MVHLIIELSKYGLSILVAMYTFLNFSAMRKKTERSRGIWFSFQNLVLFFLHFLAYLVIFFQKSEVSVLIFYVLQVTAAAVFQLLYLVLYPEVNRVVLNNTCFFLSVSMIILTRIDMSKAVRQFVIACISMAISLIVPLLIRKFRFLKDMTAVYGIAGIAGLSSVVLIGAITHGAKLSITLAGVTLQPSEFVKILFALFVGARLAKSTEFKDVVLTTVFAALHVIVLVISKDLGAALILFFMYLVVLYAATGKKLYLFAGMGAGVVGSVAAYHLFSHIRVRVLAWKDPFAYIDSQGYQITQSLFAIGTGGWFGLGLMQGTPGKIPYVAQDFVFSAIAEEMGGIFALCLILVCGTCFLMFVNIAMRLDEPFYRYASLGLAALYGIQVFLTIGGGIKLIPSTGVTLPLVSYGGSSMLATLLSFAIIQGMYLLKEDEEAEYEEG